MHIGSLTRHAGQEFHSVDVAAADSLGARSHEAAWDKQVDLLHKQVARAGGHLFTSLQAATGMSRTRAHTHCDYNTHDTGMPPSPNAGRVLANMAPAQAADLFLNLLAATWDDRCAAHAPPHRIHRAATSTHLTNTPRVRALQAVDLRDRLKLALELIRGLRDELQRAASAGSTHDLAARLVAHPVLRAAGLTNSSAEELGAMLRAGRGAAMVPRMPGARQADPEADELKAIMDKLRAAKPPEEVLRAAEREAAKLGRGAEFNPAATTARAYLETLADLPWSVMSHHNTQREGLPRTLEEVRAVLDRQHYGLDKIKDRIVQYVAVRRLRGWDTRAPILCFIGARRG